MSDVNISARAKLALSTLAAACLLATASSAVAAIPEPVQLDSGRLGGSIESAPGIREFRGIPFAAPPVGDLRWREPQPVPQWSGVRSAAEFGDVCVQPDGGARGNIALLPEGIGMSEDCLYLNVWTGADTASERRPVMMYIFGGAYSEGAGSAPLYNGTELAKKGAVVVTMNYRLGAFGFFAHPALTADSPNKTSGNYGIMDMLAALEWIQANIEQFGGDPNNVTVFGQSAGAMAIGTLVASPKAKGLFHRAISQSGTWMGLNMSTTMGTREQMEQRGKTAADNLGVTTAAELRALSTEQAQTLPASGNFIVDGYLLPENATDIFVAGRQNKVDVLTGSNKEELSFGGGGGGRRGGGAAAGGGRAGGPGGPGGARGRGGPGGAGRGGPGGFAAGGRGGPGGPGGAPGGAPGRGGPGGGRGAGGPGGPGGAAGGANAQNDGPFWVARFFADKQLEQGNKAWLYYFTQNPPGPNGTSLPAVHASEVPYVFNNLGEKPLFPDTSDPALSAASADDQKVADLMSSYWVNFARTGDPNGPGLPTWRPHEVGHSDTAMILDAHPETESAPPRERLQAIDDRFNAAIAGN